MTGEFETPLTPPAPVPVQPPASASEPQVPQAPQNLVSPMGTYFGDSAYPGPQQHNQSAYQIVNVYQNGPMVRRTNGMAIGSLVTGIFGMFPLAIPLGLVALNRISKTGEAGRWQAITGLVLGGFHAFGWAIVTIPAIMLTTGA